MVIYVPATPLTSDLLLILMYIECNAASDWITSHIFKKLAGHTVFDLIVCLCVRCAFLCI